MENDIIDGLEDIGYTGPMKEEENLEQALDGGPKSVEYTTLVEWLSKELKILCKLDEHVNAIASPDDSSSFMLELSSFLKELGCLYSCLVEGHMNDRLNSKEQRILLLDFLLSELQAARMISVNKPEVNKTMEVQLTESSTANDLKNMLIALKFPKPPPNITAALLFGKVEHKMKEVLATAPVDLIGKPLFNGILSGKQWDYLGKLQQELQREYKMRREMLVKRMDVTVQSFQWSERVKNQEDQIVGLYMARRKQMNVEPNIHLSDLIAARGDLAVIEKTSSASVRKNTQSSINKVIIGRVPDRGGRPSEQQPPPPEMPSWQQQKPGGGGSGARGFHGGRGGGGGGDRGGRVQGGWNQGGRGRGYQGGGTGSYHGGGGGASYQDRGASYQDRGASYQDRGASYQDRGASYQDRGASYQDRGASYQDRGASYQDRGASYQDRGASYQDRGGSGHRGGGGVYQDRGGGYQERSGSYQDRGGSYQDRVHQDRSGKGRGGRGRSRDHHF